MYTTLEIERQASVATLWMNRSEVFNAFNETLIGEIEAACQELEMDASVRVVVLAGRGKHFSAGADLNWMQRAAQYSYDENLRDARALASMLRTLAELKKPTVARIQGAALGGGTGLAAACDMVIATETASFATSEARFGIIPATISPYVLRAIGARHALRYFQSAERISAAEALRIGLVTEVVAEEFLDTRIDEMTTLLKVGGPQAQVAAKDLIRSVAGRAIDDALIEETAQRIAHQRIGEEAQEGFAAFFAKRPPNWLD